MSDFKEPQLYNFIDSRLLPKVTTTALCTEYHEVENLISDNFLTRSRGFVADTTTRPPIEVTFELLCPITVHYIIISRNLNHDHSVTIEILTRRGNGNFRSIAYENFTTNGIVLCNPRENHPTNVDQNYRKTFFKPHAFVAFSTADWVKIKIVRTERAVPSLGRVEIWGTVSRTSSHDTVTAVNRLMHNKSATTVVQSNKNLALREDFEIPEDFTDALTFEVMSVPVTLPSGNTIDQSTLDKCIENDMKFGRVGSDPFTGQNFTDTRKPILNVALKHRINMFLLQNAHRKETFSIQRTVGAGGVKRKLDEEIVSVKTVVPSVKSTQGQTSADTLDLAIEKTLNSKGFIRFTNDEKSESINCCVQCSSVENLYTIPCNHFHCRNCLLIIYKSMKCGSCKTNFDRRDPKKVNV